MARCFRLPVSTRLNSILASAALSATLFALTVSSASAQISYTCFPTCDATDGRFLALSGTDYNAFAGDEIVMGIGMPTDSSYLELGIFDGNSGGMWDFSAAPLEYVLFADPLGTGERAVEVGRWLGTTMADNAWHTIRQANVPSAKALNGNYVYFLRIRSTDSTIKSTSSFKVRTNGTITIKSHQSFSIYGPLTKLADAAVIYPLYPDRSVSTYDGSWKLFVDVPEASSQLVVWDGDMDHGSYDGYRMDSDDPDTPNDLPPTWATPTAVAEGNATSAWAIRDTARPGSEIRMSGDPADDNQNEFYRRSPAVRYHVIDPVGNVYANRNPSGNLEWEQFRIATAPFDSTIMDHHADSVVAGIYEVRVSGMDMGNVNSWRFFNELSGASSIEVVGVDIAGNPVVPFRAVQSAGTTAIAGGVVYFDSDVSGAQGAGEPGIASVAVQLIRHETNGSKRSIASARTNSEGAYRFDSVAAGTYSISVDTRTLPKEVVATADADGLTTPNSAAFTVSSPTTNLLTFGYRASSTVGTRTRGYWSNHGSRWPLESITLGAITYTKQQALAILNTPTLGDRTVALASQLIATKLNLAKGCDASCIGTTVVDADAWLTTYPVGTGSNSACDWSVGEPLHIRLDAYNNGLLCAPHED